MCDPSYTPISFLNRLAIILIFFADVSNVDRSWKKLVNVLAGQFCASLNFMDSSQTVSPKWSFQPKGSVETVSHFEPKNIALKM